MIDERTFLDWLQHPMTVEFRKVLAAKREELRQQWEKSEPSAYTREELILANVGNIGWCRGLAFAETMDYEDYLTETGANDGEQKRPPAGGSGSAD